MALNNQGIMQVSNNGKYANWDDMPASLQEGVFAKLTAGYPNQALQRSRIYNAMRDPATMRALMTKAGVYDENAQLADPATQPNVLDDIMAMDGTDPAPVPARKPMNGGGDVAPAPNVAQGPGGIGSDYAANMGNLPRMLNEGAGIAPDDQGTDLVGLATKGAAVGGGLYLLHKLRQMGMDNDTATAVGQQVDDAIAEGRLSPDAVKSIADDPMKMQQLAIEGPAALLALPDYSQQPKPLAPPGPRPDFFMPDRSNEQVNPPANDMERNIDKSLVDGENAKPKPKGVKAKTAKAKPRPRVRP